VVPEVSDMVSDGLNVVPDVSKDSNAFVCKCSTVFCVTLHD